MDKKKKKKKEKNQAIINIPVSYDDLVCLMCIFGVDHLFIEEQIGDRITISVVDTFNCGISNVLVISGNQKVLKVGCSGQ